MNIFLSYSSTRRDVAERLKLALEAEHHEVFFDRDDLGAGEAFHQAIRAAIEAADLMIFLVSPESVASGSYALAELAIAERRWPRPAGHVLPVVVAPTPKGSIPPYLLAVTLLEPRGEAVAESLAAVARLSGAGASRRWIWPVAAVVLAAVLAGGYRWDLQRRTAAAEAAEAARVAEEARGAMRLCAEGHPADAFARLSALVATQGATGVASRTQEDCAMLWLREARVTGGVRTFAEFVAPLRPVLTRALLAGPPGERAADLRAHLGWADYLTWRDQRDPAADPLPSYRKAVQDDAGNVYAHAMWAHWLLRNGASRREEALLHFETALAGGRDRAFVRVLQLGSMVTREGLEADALRALNQMRLGGEPVADEPKGRIWSYLYAGSYRGASRERMLGALSPEDGLKTFLWLFPRDGHPDRNRVQWQLVNAQFLVNAGRAAEARPDLLALQKELRAERASGPLVDEVNRLLALQ